MLRELPETAARYTPAVSTSKPRRPSCPALICCEHVEVDAQKGRIDIHNVVNAILLETIPGDIRFAVHFSLTEGLGRLPTGAPLTDQQRSLTFKFPSTSA